MHILLIGLARPPPHDVTLHFPALKPIRSTTHISGSHLGLFFRACFWPVAGPETGQLALRCIIQLNATPCSTLSAMIWGTRYLSRSPACNVYHNLRPSSELTAATWSKHHQRRCWVILFTLADRLLHRICADDISRIFHMRSRPRMLFGRPRHRDIRHLSYDSTAQSDSPCVILSAPQIFSPQISV